MALTQYEINNLLEELLRLQDSPYAYNNLIARILNDLLSASQSQAITYDGGVPYTLDPSRNKLLSLARPMFTAGYQGFGVTSRYLQVPGDVATMGQQGILLPRAATITAIAAKSRTTGGWLFEVRRNGVNMTVASQAVSMGAGSNPNLNIDLDAGDWLQFFANGTNIGFPVASIELAWRKP
jgi:hypothetical protein